MTGRAPQGLAPLAQGASGAVPRMAPRSPAGGIEEIGGKTFGIALPAGTPSLAGGERPHPRPAPLPAGWGLAAFTGRLGEICGGRDSAVLTFAVRLVLEAQRRGEPAAWITRRDRWFYPPDAAEVGVDLGALVVVLAGEGLAGVQAADLLVRSGGFGLVVLDLGPGAKAPVAVQARLGGLAKKHGTAVVFLTDAAERRGSLGSLVSVRAQAARAGHEEDRFRCRARILKDKRRGPGGAHAEVFHGPDGLR